MHNWIYIVIKASIVVFIFMGLDRIDGGEKFIFHFSNSLILWILVNYVQLMDQKYGVRDYCVWFEISGCLLLLFMVPVGKYVVEDFWFAITTMGFPGVMLI